MGKEVLRVFIKDYADKCETVDKLIDDISSDSINYTSKIAVICALEAVKAIYQTAVPILSALRDLSPDDE